ncbi:hypothetical protein CCMSSC00406_0006545 [Pleurotus cornucopiae]|uniref:Uncharacterized protein n=1 Tax=Pleurotus cornucopiae TaxID=5321 RepID=A0ACB7IVL1_PLECO|nr:hypothetical protein CCMSSC00406_0006545 [Pleurotus cornucopiae]
MPAGVPDVQAIVTPTVGALLIGVLFSICLFGANTLQTWYYYQHYPSDGIHLKLWACCGSLNFTNVEGLDTTIWSATMTLLITGVLILLVHSFFAWRIYILSGRKPIIPLFILLLAVAHAAITWGVVGISFAAGAYSRFPKTIQSTSTSSLAIGVATDLTIACSLGYYLHRGRSGISRTDQLINKLIFWAVNIGLLTSITDFVVLMVSELMDNLIFLAIYQIISNLYAASMLATLNLRPFSRDHVLDEHGTVLELGSFHASAPASSKINKASLPHTGSYTSYLTIIYRAAPLSLGIQSQPRAMTSISTTW